MSIEIMSAVWKAAPYTGTRLLVLLALADAASQEGFCWPSLATIAERGRCNVRNAQVHLRAITEDGWVERVPRSGQSNLYHVFTTPQARQQPASQPAPRGVATDRGGCRYRQGGGVATDTQNHK